MGFWPPPFPFPFRTCTPLSEGLRTWVMDCTWKCFCAGLTFLGVFFLCVSVPWFLSPLDLDLVVCALMSIQKIQRKPRTNFFGLISEFNLAGSPEIRSVWKKSVLFLCASSKQVDFRFKNSSGLNPTKGVQKPPTKNIDHH